MINNSPISTSITTIMEASTSGRKRLKQSTLDENVKRKKTDGENIESDKRAGVITRIILKNFMCHSLLEVNFTSNTSVFTGQNGSGKSAILTALVVGFGGKASLTNRGTSIKGFVKAGKNSASVEITLYNGGLMAYRPNTYGPSITIIRNFTAAGTSSYKVKNHAGEIVTTQGKEIRNIATSLNIQVDNPICVLNQDTSRNFLCSNDPKQKFTLFMRATKLDTLSSEYHRITTNMRDSLRLLEEKTNDIQRMRADIKTLKSKIDQHKSMRNLKEEELALQTELLWAKVRDAEAEVLTHNENIDKLMKKCEGFKTNSNKRSEEVQTLKKSIREIEHQLEELKNNIEVSTRPYTDAKKTIEKLNKVFQEKNREKISLRNTIKSKTQDIKVLEDEIANANENKNKIEEVKANRSQQIKELEQKLKANDDILQTARNELFQLQTDLSRKEDSDTNFKVEVREVDQKINQFQEQVNSLENESGNTLLLYGRHTPKIRQLINENAKRFHHLPRGPLGSYIKLKDKKWAVAAEGYLGKALLNSFIVDNKHDNQLLLQIFNKVAPNQIPTIITSKFYDKVHNVSSNLVQAPTDCVSLFDVLEIDDPVVTNCIIDESNVEGILLIPTDDRAMNLLSNRENVPANCTQGVTIKGDRYFPDPNYKTYCSDYHQAQYLQVDTKEHLKLLKYRIETFNQQKHAIMNQYKQVKQEMEILTNKKNELDTKIRRIMSNRSDLRRQLDEIRSTSEPEVANIEVLENELEEVRTALNDKMANLERINGELKELADPIKETENRIGQLKIGIRNLEDRLPTLQEQIREKNARIKEISTNEGFDNRKIAEFEARLKESRAILVTKQSNVIHHTTKAEDVGKRPENIRLVPEIIEKLNNIEKSLRQIHLPNGSVEEVIEQYKTLGEKFSNASLILEKLNEDVRELRIAAKIRKKHYKVTETYFIQYIKHSFKKVLQIRQFEGFLNIDVEAKQLELIVIPQQGTQGLTKTSNLSGGERSFSTVAFLYSLWQCMEFPFYFLDEFDVYMDKLNRTKVFDILLHHANSKPQLQFVFLTPQDVSFLKNNVAVLRLENPKRFNAS